MKRQLYFLLLTFFIFSSCENGASAFRFSNFYDTPAEAIAKAIRDNDVKKIKEELKSKKININFKDKEYEVSLLALALVNNKKDAFNKLLELGANPNVENSYCVGPLNTAIRYNSNCDVYFIKTLLEYGSKITPEFFSKCNSYFALDPIAETILYYNKEDKVNCGFKILKLLTSKLNDPGFLLSYNDSVNYRQNIIYNCLSTNRNMSALKYFIVDLKSKVPEKIFIDGTVLFNSHGYMSLKEILQDKTFVFEHSEYREKAKQEILAYLSEKK